MHYGEIKNSAMSELKRMFNPEFINRVDEIVVFHSLDKEHLKLILAMMIAEVDERLVAQQITLDISAKARDYLIDKGFDEKYGARPLRRILQKEVEDPLSLELLKGRFREGSAIAVDIKEDKIVFRHKRKRKALEAKKAELVVQ
jgi:ATP-dependent Clp protease ATP-binding subunit ClpC